MLYNSVYSNPHNEQQDGKNDPILQCGSQSLKKLNSCSNSATSKESSIKPEFNPKR